jgi:ubiquitin carboxyl-terminal hydrolase L3
VERRQKIWIPLESSPKLYTEYAEKLGFDTEQYRFYDVFSMEPDVWQNFIPSPILAVVLLYQVNKDKDMLYPDNVYYLPKDDVSAQPFFLRQTIGNACGTVALLHALCNNEDKCDKGFVRNSFLDTFCTNDTIL